MFNVSKTADDPIKAFEDLPEGARAELIDGEIVMMGSPSRIHNDVGVDLIRQLAAYLRGKKCKLVYEHDVRLDRDKNTIYQPDIAVVCDKSKTTPKRVVGAPDLIIEIVSPSSRAMDRVRKFNDYLAAGVREYWIVEPDLKSVFVNLLQNGQYVTSPHTSDEKVLVSVLDDCVIDLAFVFAAITFDEEQY